MSKQSRQRLREGMQQQPQRRFRWIFILALVAMIVMVAFWKQRPPSELSATPSTNVASGSQFPPKNFSEVCVLSSNDLERCDIALMNLHCAEGLRGAENLKVSESLASLDGFTKYVKQETDRHLYKFQKNPTEFQNSEGYFRMMMMVTVLQQDLKIHYNSERIQLPWEPLESNDDFFANSQDVFIHGVTREKGTGTCSSMPVLYVAIGRRLNYPLKLVKAKGHLFARWDDGNDSFNIEGTTIGFVSHPDDYYRIWPASFTPEEGRAESYLQSLNPAQELAVFLSIRGHCLRAQTNYLHALGAFAQASRKEPQSIGYQKLFARAEYEAYNAGVLPIRASLQFRIRSLQIPSGPSAAYFAAKKAELNAKNLLEADPSEIEEQMELLRLEMKASGTQ